MILKLNDDSEINMPNHYIVKKINEIIDWIAKWEVIGKEHWKQARQGKDNSVTRLEKSQPAVFCRRKYWYNNKLRKCSKGNPCVDCLKKEVKHE